MKKKEFKVGEIFQYKGINLKCEKAESYCQGCYFYTEGIKCNSELEEVTGSCVIFDREDKQDVIFVKVEE